MIARQAVILCGGRGTRLRPLTDTLPKPLAPAGGAPFLQHLLRQLERNGYREILLLTGYLGHLIASEFGDGSHLGLQITYQHGPEEWETALRLQNARALVRDHFLLLYGDNYANFQSCKLEEVFLRFGRMGCLTVSPRQSRVNVAFDASGAVTVYDSSRTAAGLNGVEIGYGLFSKEVFFYFNGRNESFSKVLGRLGESGQLCAYRQAHPYYSVSDPERLRLTDAFLSPQKTLLIDRDGTINRKMPRGEYVQDWAQFEFIPENLEAMTQLAAAGWRFVVISNQAGVGRGMLTEAQVWELDRRMVEALAERQVNVIKSYYCFHHWNEGCLCRKPQPGLLLQASAEHLLNLETTWYLGDDLRDCTAAWRAGCPAVLVGAEDPLQLPALERPAFHCQNLLGFASLLLAS
jgi:histidinol-phosphate phosphatase family protein